MFIVIYTKDQDRSDSESDWHSFETFEEAQEEYKSLIDDPRTYTASICGVIESTDYTPTHIAFLQEDPT